MSKKALIVGINDFEPGINPLRGCINDTIEMQELLETYFSFQDGEIKVLQDKDATTQGIRDGLDWLLSEYEGNGKDIRVFTFSSHGTQVDDQGDDEWDCVDEVIVTQDHSWTDPFRDDDLRAIFDPIPEDVNFTFIADCCHSGTIQRPLLESGIEFERRYLTPPPDISAEIDRKVARRNTSAKKWAKKEFRKLMRETPPEEWDSTADAYLDQLFQRYRQNKYGAVEVERHVLLAACEDGQTAADAYLENDYRGAFTWALATAIKGANGDLTYDQLITRAGANLSGFAQKPQLECPAELQHIKLFAPLA